GFIGSHLVDALVARGDEVVVVDNLSSGKREFVNERATFVEADVRDGLDADRADVVFHLAAQADVQTSVRRPDYDADVNVVGTVKVAEAARAAGVRDREALRRGVPARVEPYLRPGARRLAARERLRAAAGLEPRRRRRLDLPRAARPRRADDDLR